MASNTDIYRVLIEILTDATQTLEQLQIGDNTVMCRLRIDNIVKPDVARRVPKIHLMHRHIWKLLYMVDAELASDSTVILWCRYASSVLANISNHLRIITSHEIVYRKSGFNIEYDGHSRLTRILQRIANDVLKMTQ